MLSVFWEPKSVCFCTPISVRYLARRKSTITAKFLPNETKRGAAVVTNKELGQATEPAQQSDLQGTCWGSQVSFKNETTLSVKQSHCYLNTQTKLKYISITIHEQKYGWFPDSGQARKCRVKFNCLYAHWSQLQPAAERWPSALHKLHHTSSSTWRLAMTGARTEHHHTSSNRHFSEHSAELCSQTKLIFDLLGAFHKSAHTQRWKHRQCEEAST